MSTKIYYAYKVRHNYLKDVIPKYVDIMRPVIYDHVLEYIQSVGSPGKDGVKLSAEQIFDSVFEFFKAHSEPPFYSPDDPTCYSEIFHDGLWCYIRICTSGFWHRFEEILSPQNINVPTYQEYRFWDNSDKPKNISARDWRKREKTWDRMYDGRNPVPSTRLYFFETTQRFWSYNFDWFFIALDKSHPLHHRIPRNYFDFIVQNGLNMQN